MRLLARAAVLLTAAVLTSLAAEYGVGEDTNGLLGRLEAPIHRQIDFGYREGDEIQPQDDIGFFQGNNLPRPSGLNSLGGFNSPAPSDGFQPDSPVGRPPPFTNLEFSAPNHFPDLGPQAPRPPPAPPNSPDTNLPTTIIVGPVPKGNGLKRRPNRRPAGRKPNHHRPNRPAGRGRPHKQFIPKTESTNDGLAAEGSVRGAIGARGRINGNRVREEGVTGFFKSLRRLIQRVM